MFTIRDKDLAARIGTLKLKSGKKIETPYLFPVVNPYQSEVSYEDIKKVGFDAILLNAYILLKHKFSGEVHKLTNFEKIMTDSGAYQLLQYGDIDVTNEEIIEYEKKINTDIAVILDYPTGKLDYESAKFTVEETIKRAKEAKNLIDDKRLWVYPIQGGMYEDLLELSVKEGMKLNYDIYAIGSPTVLMTEYNYDKLFRIIYKVKSILYFNKPVHLFGAGHAHLIPFAVALGIDLFDSASYILFARDFRYMSFNRTYDFFELEYLPCSCEVCRKYSVEELREMNEKELIRLLAIHNLYVLKKELENTKQAIKEGRLWEYLREKSYSHPALYKAFKQFKDFKDFLKSLSPFYKTSQKAIFLYDSFDLNNPKVLIAKEKLREMNKEVDEKILLFPYLLWKKDEKSLEKFAKKYSEYKVYLYSPYFGILKFGLRYSYPFFQSEINEDFDREVLEDLSNEINSFLENKKIKHAVIIIPKGYVLKIKSRRNLLKVYI
ncbi:MAG: tRNA guanosine(15) transglycosylase TgtA [Candidatus Aenigmatarchaeota archaeon]